MSETNSDQPLEEHYNAPLRPHDFDGIHEFDNKLPNWWLWTFFGAMIFSVVYWFGYQVLHVWAGSLESYQIEVKKHEAERDRLIAQTMDLTDEGLLKLSKDPEAVARGKATFHGAGTCWTCHAVDGSGGIGPNLTDDYWLHGGKPGQIYRTVNHGVPLKGMEPWGPKLGPKRVADVVAYVLTIKGTHKKGKAPQGELEKDEPKSAPPAKGKTEKDKTQKDETKKDK